MHQSKEMYQQMKNTFLNLHIKEAVIWPKLHLLAHVSEYFMVSYGAVLIFSDDQNIFLDFPMKLHLCLLLF